MTTQKLRKALLAHIPYGGVTLSAEAEVLTAGIAVALDSTSEYKIPNGDNWLEFYIHEWLMFKHDTAVGMWVDDLGDIYLDRVRVFDKTDLAGALAHAVKHNQRAIQFLDQNTTLWLTPPRTQ